MDKLDAIFSPQSVAVIGASTTPGKVGHDIFANILKGGYKGTLYPVNPVARSILSVRAYPSITRIPDDIDLAMIILPPQNCLRAVEEAIQKGVKGISCLRVSGRWGRKGLRSRIGSSPCVGKRISG